MYDSGSVIFGYVEFEYSSSVIRFVVVSNLDEIYHLFKPKMTVGEFDNIIAKHAVYHNGRNEFTGEELKEFDSWLAHNSCAIISRIGAYESFLANGKIWLNQHQFEKLIELSGKFKLIGRTWVSNESGSDKKLFNHLRKFIKGYKKEITKSDPYTLYDAYTKHCATYGYAFSSMDEFFGSLYSMFGIEKEDNRIQYISYHSAKH